jgi:uncharacterized protein (DUF697 family)
MATDLVASREIIRERFQDLKGVLNKVIERVVTTDPTHIRDYVDKLRLENPELDDDGLAKLVVSRKALKNGCVGAFGSLGGAFALPVAVPAEWLATWRIQANMALAIAYVYGHTLEDRNLKSDILLIMAGDAALSTLKDVGIEVTQRVTRNAIQSYLTEEVLKKLIASLPKVIIGRTTRKASQRFMRLVPIASAPVGFAFDYAAAKAIGKAAIHYYSPDEDSKD